MTSYQNRQHVDLRSNKENHKQRKEKLKAIVKRFLFKAGKTSQIIGQSILTAFSQKVMVFPLFLMLGNKYFIY